MPRLPGEHYQLEVSSAQIRLFQCRRWPARAPRLLAQAPIETGTSEPLPATDVWHNVLSDVLRQHTRPHWPVDVIVDVRLSRLWQVTPVAGTRRHSDLIAAAAWRYRHLYGEHKPAWHMTADWQTERPFIGAAIPESLLAALTLVTREHRLALTSVTPQFIALWNRWRKQLRSNDWFGVVHAGLLYVGATSGHHLISVRSIPLPAAEVIDPLWMRALLAREAMLLDMPEPASIMLCADLVTNGISDGVAETGSLSSASFRIVGSASVWPVMAGAV